VIDKVGFDNAYTFIYSEREKTSASTDFVDDVSREVKVDRLTRVSELIKRRGLELLKSDIGKVKEVLVESVSKKRDWQYKGRTEQNRIVIFDKKGELNSGDYVNIKITSADGVTLFGEIV